MKKLINKKYLSILIFLLSIIVLIKILWIGISIFFLPNSGIEYRKNNSAKPLYYRVRLSNEAAAIAATALTQQEAEKQRQQALQLKNASMNGYKLIALYHSSDRNVVTVEKGRKTTVLGDRDKVDGFEFVAAGSNYAIFLKRGTQYTLKLSSFKSPTKKPIHKHKKVTQVTKTTEIVERDGVKLINRNLLTSYTKDMKKIWSDIGIAPNSVNGSLKGYKINYVKRKSDFEKLGLKRGDILVAINAEELNSISAAMNVFKDINNIENLTLTVERNGIREDIEYEIQ